MYVLTHICIYMYIYILRQKIPAEAMEKSAKLEIPLYTH